LACNLEIGTVRYRRIENLTANLEKLIVTQDEILIRHAGPLDEPRTALLIKRCLPDDSFPYAENIRWRDRYISVVAESCQAGIVGYTTLLIEATPKSGTEEWRKYSLYIGVTAVDEAYRRRGICHRMLDFLARAARERAPYHDLLHLHVRQDNLSAKKCFERFGFQQVSEYRPAGDGKPSWLMHMNIRAYSL
jgi:ribosomal protein S18 acetylase RimI-like enzyme